MTYAVHSVFLTLQGEGYWVGRRAVFVRFAGCNAWSGDSKDRERDSRKATCARWCDTEFRFGKRDVSGGTFTAQQLASEVLRHWSNSGPRPGQAILAGRDAFVVLTGGEPSLQVDHELVDALHTRGFFVAMETNGSNRITCGVNWITVSPKPPLAIVDQPYDELKVVVPEVDPTVYKWVTAKHRFVQPVDGLLKKQATDAAIKFVRENPSWRLSVQQHKQLELP